MRTTDMLYQAAISHQSDLRRAASSQRQPAERDGDHAPAGLRLSDHLVALFSFRRQQARTAAATMPTGGVRHIAT